MSGDHEDSTKTSAEKKLRLFGFELDPYKNGGTGVKESVERDESVNSSSTTVSSLKEKLVPNKKVSSMGESDREEEKKFECQYCFKEFANSQALGGHQNAHKKERMKKKRLQLQARKASINYYLQPLQNNRSFNYHAPAPLFYDPSCYAAHEFPPYAESQISFSQSQVSKWYALPSGHLPFQDDTRMFTLTHTNRSRENRPLAIKTLPLPLPRSNQNCTSLDLQLGLSS